MTLDEYLKEPDALSVRELCAAIGVTHVAQVTQWRHGYNGRLPSPANCVAIERATGGRVRRQDLRDDWRDIWPELIDAGDGSTLKAAA